MATRTKVLQKIIAQRVHADCGVALPIVLFLILVMMSVGAILSRISSENLKMVKLNEASADTFKIAEGGVHDLLRNMSVVPHLWRAKPTLEVIPAGYSSYVPADYASSNGIPTCNGLACQRSLYPNGGGLIKNFGPIGGDGDTVDSAHSIVDQLDPNSPAESDVSINGRGSWTQVEKLDETTPGTTSVGGDLSNNPRGGSAASVMRFRLTGTALRAVRGRKGRTTVVTVVEIPAA